MGFLKHEACPRCREVGNDRSGNNLARYDNGSAFCFSCRYVERADKYSPVSGSREGGERPPRDLTPIIPSPNKEWLEKYLIPEEIRKHFVYSPSLGRHIFQEGSYWEARSVTKQPKTLCHGNKPFVLFGNGNVLVVVEDVVSAIKVGRIATGLPLFGNSLSPDRMVRIVKLGFSRVLIWLDPDMVEQSRKLARKLNALAPIARSVMSEMDPKDYSTEQIREIINEAIRT